MLSTRFSGNFLVNLLGTWSVSNLIFASSLNLHNMFKGQHVLKGASKFGNFSVRLGRFEWWTSPGLPNWWSLLLSLSTRVIWLSSWRPGPCSDLHLLHARLLCLLLQDLDWGVRILCQRCESALVLRWAMKFLFTTRWFFFLPPLLSLLSWLCQVAKQLKEQQMVMRGHRETSMVHELNR